jgi:hypothetical protein
MPDKIIQLNDEAIKKELGEDVRLPMSAMNSTSLRRSA